MSDETIKKFFQERRILMNNHTNNNTNNKPPKNPKRIRKNPTKISSKTGIKNLQRTVVKIVSSSSSFSDSDYDSSDYDSSDSYETDTSDSETDSSSSDEESKIKYKRNNKPKTSCKPRKRTYKKKPIPAVVKRLVWNTYIGEDVGKSKCLCCKLTDITQMSFHCGHIVSEKNGGSTSVDNLVPVCQNCNSSMGANNMDEFMRIYKLV